MSDSCSCSIFAVFPSSGPLQNCSAESLFSVIDTSPFLSFFFSLFSLSVFLKEFLNRGFLYTDLIFLTILVSSQLSAVVWGSAIIIFLVFLNAFLILPCSLFISDSPIFKICFSMKVISSFILLRLTVFKQFLLVSEIKPFQRLLFPEFLASCLTFFIHC